ncbi:MAG TPA: tetratricopeptide repeat protein [Caulobacteraceae bacterium]
MASRLVALGLALTLGAATAGSAQAAGPAAQVPDAATLATDSGVVSQIFAATQSQGFNAIGARLADLNAVLAHAPTRFAATEIHGGVAYVRTRSVEDCLMATMAVAMAMKKTPGLKKAVCVDNPYPFAAFLIGSYLDEVQKPEEALPILERGLTFDPQFPMLVAEKGAALNMLRRNPEALAEYQAGLAKIALLSAGERGMMLRGEGFALTELKRYDEAAKAYQDSLKVDPDHGHAAHELEYIARLRAGAPTAGMVIDSALRPSPAPK